MASTAVASMQNTAAPDSASELMCVKCQSLASPSTDEYWHIGATMMRLGSFRPRSWIGENKALIRRFPGEREQGPLYVANGFPLLNHRARNPPPYCLIPAALTSAILAAVSRLTRSS